MASVPPLRGVFGIMMGGEQIILLRIFRGWMWVVRQFVYLHFENV